MTSRACIKKDVQVMSCFTYSGRIGQVDPLLSWVWYVSRRKASANVTFSTDPQDNVPFDLLLDDQQIKVNPGDVLIYNGDCFFTRSMNRFSEEYQFV